MDGIIVWKPWWVNKAWTPNTEGLHVDQNPFDKPYLDCYQGMVPLYDVTDVVGGLTVVPNTHKNDWKDRYKYLKGRGDWCTISGRLGREMSP